MFNFSQSKPAKDVGKIARDVKKELESKEPVGSPGPSTKGPSNVNLSRPTLSLDGGKKQKKPAPSQPDARHVIGNPSNPINYDDVVARFGYIVEETSFPAQVGFIPPRPEQFDHCMLLNVEYDRETNKALMRFYDPVSKKILFLTDPTNHEPYCLHRLPKSVLEKQNALLNVDGFKRIEAIKKIDLIDYKEKEFSKLVGTTPLTIASGSSSIKNILPDVLEANIRYHLNYIADRGLVPGLYYSYSDGMLKMDAIPIADSVKQEIAELMKHEKEEYTRFFTEYFELFVPEVPDFPRVAIDLEIYQEYENKFPDPAEAKEPIIAASVVSNDGVNEVLVWKGHKLAHVGDENRDFPPGFKVRVFADEAQLIRALFRYLWMYPIVITYNGDEFDLRYLHRRAKQKHIKIPDEENPILMERGTGISNNSAFLKYGLHLDLYQFFRNRSIQGYALSGAYSEFSLDAVSRGLLGAEKFKFEGNISELSFFDLVYYNWKDSDLTLNLTTFRANLTMNLVVLLMRICRLPMNEIVRTWVSSWVKQLLIWEHRKRNYVVPNQEEIMIQAPPEDGLKGAFVFDPNPGIYFDVVVMDFSSLYPSIIKEYNLSYETINCKCEGTACKKTLIPNTNYHACTNHIGIMSLVTGVIRDLRVLYFKPKSKKNEFYNTLQSALKVLINASYGVYGSENFALYCYPVADSTTAVGRYSIMNTAKKAQDIGATVLYGDSDSVFLKNPGPEKIAMLREWAEKELKLELDVDKAYRFLALSERKKNYLGVFKGGGVDIKGLTGKKSNTPQFIRDAFMQFTELIATVSGETDFKERQEEIRAFIRKYWLRIKKNQLALPDYEIRITLQGKIVKQVMDDAEPKIKVQHLMAARDLRRLKGIKIEPGYVLSFVKVRTGAKALELASLDEIDRDKYAEQFKSTFEQILDALGISFEEIIGIKKLDSYF